jgi:hypothetical protein
MSRVATAGASDRRNPFRAAPCTPRIIHIPLSGGDRKALAKGVAYRESVLIRSAAEAKLREADRLECEPEPWAPL